MKKLSFTITGNQEDPHGNPIGYHRTTQGSYWNAGSRRYAAWKGHVVAAYVDTQPAKPIKIKAKRIYEVDMKKLLTGKPIDLEGKKAYLHTKIYYANRARPDPDNVQKGIADALFVNDKNVAGSYDFELAADRKGRVLVEINIVD